MPQIRQKIKKAGAEISPRLFRQTRRANSRIGRVANEELPALHGGRHKGSENCAVAGMAAPRFGSRRLRSINNVVDVTNYVLMEYGQPLHSFDAAKIRGKKIVVRQAENGEEIQTLDEKKYRLTPEATLICDGEGAVALAGIMGGLNSEVTDSTTDLVIESAYFNPGNTRATSRKYGISTDSSYRFARDVDPEIDARSFEARGRFDSRNGGRRSRGRPLAKSANCPAETATSK